MCQVRNELTSAEFALNLNGAATGRGNKTTSVENSAPRATAAVGGGVGGVGDDGGVGGAGNKSEIDYDSIAERLEASLRALQAGRPLSLMEAISQDEVGRVWDGRDPRAPRALSSGRGGGRVEVPCFACILWYLVPGSRRMERCTVILYLLRGMLPRSYLGAFCFCFSVILLS